MDNLSKPVPVKARFAWLFRAYGVVISLFSWLLTKEQPVERLARKQAAKQLSSKKLSARQLANRQLSARKQVLRQLVQERIAINPNGARNVTNQQATTRRLKKVSAVKANFSNTLAKKKQRRALPVIKKPRFFSVLEQSVLPFGLCMVALVLTVSFALPLKANREVLSGLDCVVEPSALIKLGSTVPGLLAATAYDKSDFVRPGTVMATLESRLEEATLAISEEIAAHATAVELRKTTASFGARTQERNASLLRTSSISKQNMDQVNTESKIAHLQVRQEEDNLRLAKLRVERDRVALERRMIVSPIEGTVIKRYKSAGEYVDSDPVYELAQLNPLHVEVIVPLEYLGQIEAGMEGGVTLLAPGFDDKVLDAQVRRIDAVSDAASATYGVRLVLDNPELKIPSGVRCQVDLFSS